MAKFAGRVGFATTVETSPGVWEDQVVEYPYYGDVDRNTIRRDDGEAINSDISLSHVVRIVADDFGRENLFAIRYVEWAGARWSVSSAEYQSPRLLLRLGGVYNGITASAPVSP